MSRFQFSIRLMLVAVGAVAAAVWSLVVTPSWLACIAMLWVAALFMTMTLTACIQTTGIARTFWVGAFVPVIFASIATIAGPVWFFAAHEPE